MNIIIGSKTSFGLVAGLTICTLGLTLTSNPTLNVSADSCYARGPNFDLHGCNFTSADLSNLNLFGANLSGTNLSNANLFGANLSYADLANTDFTNANLGWY